MAASSPLRPGGHYLAIDLGSSAVRAGVGPAVGSLRSVVHRPVAYLPQQPGSLALEVDPERTWRSAVRAASVARRGSGVRPRQIEGVAITAQRQSVVFLDRDLEVVLASPNRDMRAVFQGAAIDERAGDLVRRTTGHLPSYLMAWSKLRWLLEEAPQLYERVRYACTLADWIVLRLTGVLSVERAAAIESGLADITTGGPARGLAAAAGVDDLESPPLVDPGSVAGRVTREAAPKIGVRPGTPVVAAGPDTQVALLALGVSEDGYAGAVAGWSGAVQRVTQRPHREPDRRLWTGRHALTGLFVAEANTGVMGGAFEWLSGLLFPDRPREARPAALARAAESVQPGANGLTAHLGPAVLDMSDPTLRAGGFAFPVPLALDAPSPGDLGRAALENFAFAIRDALAATAHVENAEPAVALGGGLSRSRLLARVLSAVTGEPMLVGTGDDSLAGAISSAAAGKEGGSLSELSRRRRQRLRAVRPHDLDTSVYRDLYEGWKERSRALEQVAL